MQIGISTSNLYPLPLEESLSVLTTVGAEVSEVFINTAQELRPAFLSELKRRANDSGMRIVSLHSYTSCFEPYLLFSAYERRFEDGLRVFDDIFEGAALLGASYVVLHGDGAQGVLPVERSIARYEALYDRAQQHGITLLQENVVRFRAGDPAFIRAMRAQLGDKAQFVLDLKQCRRAGVPLAEMMDAMRGAVRHVHISDADGARDCLPPGQGCEAFAPFLRQLKADGFDGALIVELYRQNFREVDELRRGIQFLREQISNYIL